MDLEKKNTFNSPEGKHRAQIVDPSIQRDNSQHECLRVIYEITSTTHPVYNYMARKIYKKSDSLELLEDLYELVGEEIGNIVGENRQICEEGLQMLRWMDCDIEIEHIHSPKHETPYCRVTRVTKPGGLKHLPHGPN